MTEDVRDFVLGIPDQALDDLRCRLRRTRLPEAANLTRPGEKPDWSQGPPRAYVADLIRYWSEEYDWRRVESELNQHGQSRCRIDDLDLHFLHVRSHRPDARPLILTHGWPSSVVESLEVMDLLAHPPTPELPAFHVVAPSLPGFGFSSRPRSRGWTVERTADAWADLMDRLGYDRYFAVGGDWGGRVTTALAIQHPDRVAALHTFTPYVGEPPAGEAALTRTEAQAVADTRIFWRYGASVCRRPQTVAYGLADSPVAQLSWILEKFHDWTDWDEHPESAVGRDRILDTVMMYWLPGAGGSAVRFGGESSPLDPRSPITMPAGVTVFPKDVERLPRAWVEARFEHLMYWNEADRGGHFPMLEVPGSFVDEVRAALGSMPWRAWGGPQPRRARRG